MSVKRNPVRVGSTLSRIKVERRVAVAPGSKFSRFERPRAERRSPPGVLQKPSQVRQSSVFKRESGPFGHSILGLFLIGSTKIEPFQGIVA